MSEFKRRFYRIYYNRHVYCLTHIGAAMIGKFWIKAAIAEFLTWIVYLIYVGHYLFNSSPALQYGPVWLHFILFPLALAGWDLTWEKIDGLFLKPGYSLINGCFYFRKIFKLGIILYFATYMGIYRIVILYISMQRIYQYALNNEKDL